jgi:hypothetical protein
MFLFLVRDAPRHFKTFNLLRDAPLTRLIVRLLSSGLQYIRVGFRQSDPWTPHGMDKRFSMCNLTQECCDTLHLQEA